MVTKIDDFKSIVSRHNGLSKYSRYRVVFPTLYAGSDTQTLSALCRQAMFPGKQINTFNRQTNQKAIPVASGYSVDSAQFNFIETADQHISRYIDYWMNTVVSPRDYLLSYRNEYARDILMYRLDEQDNINYAQILRKAFPKTKFQMDYSYDNGNNFADLNVIFEYEDYEILPINKGDVIRDAANAVRLQSIRLPIPSLSNTPLNNIANTIEDTIEGINIFS